MTSMLTFNCLGRPVSVRADRCVKGFITAKRTNGTLTIQVTSPDHPLFRKPIAVDQVRPDCGALRPYDNVEFLVRQDGPRTAAYAVTKI